MTHIDIASFRKDLAALLADIPEDGLVITRYGKPIATLAAVEGVAPARKDEAAVVTAAPAVAVDPTGWITDPKAPAARVLPAAVDPVTPDDQVLGGPAWSDERIKSVEAAKAKRSAQDELLSKINRGRTK